jgi:hypothetical protein
MRCHLSQISSGWGTIALLGSPECSIESLLERLVRCDRPKDHKKKAGARDDIIHIDDSDDDAEYMGTISAPDAYIATTVPQHARLTSTRYDNIGYHMQQQHTEDIGDHFAAQQTQQQSRPHIDEPQPSLSLPLREAMSPYPEDPLTTNFHTSHVGFQNNRKTHDTQSSKHTFEHRYKTW